MIGEALASIQLMRKHVKNFEEIGAEKDLHLAARQRLPLHNIRH